MQETTARLDQVCETKQQRDAMIIAQGGVRGVVLGEGLARRASREENRARAGRFNASLDLFGLHGSDVRQFEVDIRKVRRVRLLRLRVAVQRKDHFHASGLEPATGPATA